MSYYLWSTVRGDRRTRRAAAVTRARRAGGREPVGTAPVPGADHLAVHDLVDRARADRDPVLVQRRPVAQRPGRGSRRAGTGATRTTRCGTTPIVARCPRAEPEARRCRHAGRGPARRGAGDRADALAGPRFAAASNFLMLFPLVTPEIVMAYRCCWCSVTLYTITRHRRRRSLGHVTFSISYVVVIVRGRLLSIGRQYEEAAATSARRRSGPCGSCCSRCSLPAIFASLMVVFALSIDDFVVTDSCLRRSRHETVPILIYGGHPRRRRRQPQRARDHDGRRHAARRRRLWPTSLPAVERGRAAAR